MTKLRLLSASLVASLIAAPAFAHEGEHSASFVVTAMHWLSSPTHALFASIAGIAAAALIFKIATKNKA